MKEQRRDLNSLFFIRAIRVIRGYLLFSPVEWQPNSDIMRVMQSRVTQCSFCGKLSTAIGAMVEGPADVYMCVPCLHQAKAIVGRPQRTPTCSFCGKIVQASQAVEGPNDVYMCADCVDAGLKIAAEHEAFRKRPD
jgi:hypothetical protein